MAKEAAAEKEIDKESVEEPEDKPAPAAKPKVTEDEDGAVRVQLDEEEKPRPARRERRESWKAGEEELRRAREENEQLRQSQARLEAQVQARFADMQRQIPRGEDPYEREINQIRRDQELIQTTLRSGAVQNEQEIERLRGRFYELDGRSKEVERARIKREVMDEVQQRQAQQSGQYEEQALRSEFPEVIPNQQAMRWATGRYYQLVAEGKPATLATSRAAVQEAAEHYGLRRPTVAAPTAAAQQRFGAVSAQAGGRVTGEVRLDANQKKMALARWPNIEEHEAFGKMAALLRKVDAERTE